MSNMQPNPNHKGSNQLISRPSFIRPEIPFVGGIIPQPLPFVSQTYPLVNKERGNAGFTLIELMMVIAVIAVLSSIGFPYMRDMILANRIRSQATEITGAMNLARAEAVKQKLPIGICISSGGTSCTGTDWAAGLLIWEDSDGDGSVDAGERILRIVNGSQTNITINFLTNLNQPVSSPTWFRADGTFMPATGNTGTEYAIRICDSSRTGESGRAVAIGASGRIGASAYVCT